jgi:MYXO-CTERM domain-containing protein
MQDVSVNITSNEVDANPSDNAASRAVNVVSEQSEEEDDGGGSPSPLLLLLLAMFAGRRR